MFKLSEICPDKRGCILWEWPYRRGLHFVGVALSERTTFCGSGLIGEDYILWEWPYKRGLHFVGVAL